MPRKRKPLSHYPQAYFDLTRAAALGDSAGWVDCDSPAKALSLRGHYYAFVGCLRAEALGLTARYKTDLGLAPHDQDIVDLAALSARVLVEISPAPGGRSRVEWKNREQSWQARILAGLHRPEPSLQPSGPQPSADFLRRAQAAQGAYGAHMPEAGRAPPPPSAGTLGEATAPEGDAKHDDSTRSVRPPFVRRRT